MNKDSKNNKEASNFEESKDSTKSKNSSFLPMGKSLKKTPIFDPLNNTERKELALDPPSKQSSQKIETSKNISQLIKPSDKTNTFGTTSNSSLFQQFAPKTNRQDIVSITYEEIGFFPRSFSRVLDRFLKQVFSDVENLVIQEYRFYRYLFLTTLKCVLILFFVPFIVNYLAKTYLVSPLTEYFWNSQQTEIFLNSYQQKRAFTELKDFEEKLYFESLIYSGSKISRFEEVRKSSNLSLQPTQTHQKVATAPVNCDLPEVFIKNSASNKGAMGRSCSQTILQESAVVENFNESTQKVFELSSVKKNDISVNNPSNTINKNIQKKPILFISEDKSVIENKISQNNPLKPDQSLYKGSSTSTMDEHREVEDNEVSSRSGASKILYKSNRQEVFEQRLQEKTIELANRYNNQSIEAITNFFADLLSFITLCYLLIIFEIQINITKSFLLEVFFGLDDGKKSLVILLITDLLVGYHSSNLWELFFEFLFNHYGLPESQTGIFLLVATLPVLLDVLFKYLIFRHLNRSSPATVATYHAIIE